MDTVVLAEKLESLRRCVRRIEEKKPWASEILQFINMKRLIGKLFMLSVNIPFWISASLRWRSAATPGCDFFQAHNLELILGHEI
jgi:hypothetical protein